MDGLEFIAASPPALPDPARADIGCFAGFVARHRTSGLRPEENNGPGRAKALRRLLPNWCYEWLRERGWLPAADDCSQAEFDRLLGLLDLPVPIDSWEAFDALFAWDKRKIEADAPPSSIRYSDTWLGAAVRSFFAQGGRKCYVIRAGDPWPALSSRAERVGPDHQSAAGALLSELVVSPADRSSWHGVTHLFGLPDVSFLCLPDLPDLFATETRRQEIELAAPAEEQFVECAERAAPSSFQPLRSVPAPRCDENGYVEWAIFVNRVASVIERFCREVQLIAAVPLPVNEAALRNDPALWNLSLRARQAAVADRVQQTRAQQWNRVAAIQTVFVQLAYPWLRTRNAAAVPEGIESPDGVLAGLLANAALTRGAWRSAARQFVPALLEVEPILTREELDKPLPFHGESRDRPRRSLRERVTLFGPSAAGFRLLSDVTMDDDDAWRPASLNRLMNLIVRAARLAGEQFVFANNGEQLWAQLRGALISLLSLLWADGALEGASPADAFDVRCDRTTMTQADLDAGRLVARVSFTSAAPIERFVVLLALSEGGQVSLLPTRRDDNAELPLEAA